LVPKLLLATNNPGKLREYRVLLEGIPYELIIPQDIGIKIDVDETGNTYEVNARLKATTLMQSSGLITLSDDSGLEVDALNGEPGIHSARYAGVNASDNDRIHYLMNKLKDVPLGKRTARFVCVIAIAEPRREIYLCEGVCYGVIALEPRGIHGHGYDPVFYVPELGKTMAELPMHIKNSYSHRGQAARKAREILMTLV
jgi:XTP/dITP diphosphohydrolase